MNQAHPPHIEPIEPNADFAALPELSDIIAVEIAKLDLRLHPGAPTALIVPLTPRHFDILHRDAEAEHARGIPVYFKRATTGLALHPRTNAPYWLRVTYRAPIGRGAPPPPPPEAAT